MNQPNNDILPDVIRLEPVGICNFRCIHCSTGNKPNNRKILGLDAFEAILDQFANDNFVPRVVVLYHGGEPFINQNLEYFIRRFKQLGVKKTVVTTNASLITEERARGIIDAGLDQLKVSFDGESPEENNCIRKNGNFKKDAGNIKALLAVRRKMERINPAVLISNIRICDRNTLDELNLAKKTAFPDIPIYLSHFFEKNLEEIEIESYPATIWPDYKQLGGPLKQVTYSQEKPNYCPQLFETISILSNGNVVPCCYDLRGKKVFGNIFQKQLSQIWHSEEYRKFRENFKSKSYQFPCSGCPIVTPGNLCKE